MSNNKMATKADLQEMYSRLLPYLGGSGADSYSTSEKVVGQWIDGKPIYQRTFACTMPQVTTDGTVVRTFSSIGSSISEVLEITTFFSGGTKRCGNYILGQSNFNNQVTVDVVVEDNVYKVRISSWWTSANG